MHISVTAPGSLSPHVYDGDAQEFIAGQTFDGDGERYRYAMSDREADAILALEVGERTRVSEPEQGWLWVRRTV